MIKSKRGNVEFNELVIPGAIMLAIVLVVAGIHYGFFSSEPLKEIKSEGKSVIDQIVDPIKRDLSAKGSKDPKTNAEEAFDGIVKAVKTINVQGTVKLGNTAKLGKDYAIYLGVNGDKIMLNLYDKANSKLIRNEIFDNTLNLEMGYYYTVDKVLHTVDYHYNKNRLRFQSSRVGIGYREIDSGLQLELQNFDANIKGFIVSSLPVLWYTSIKDQKGVEVRRLGWVLDEETLGYLRSGN